MKKTKMKLFVEATIKYDPKQRSLVNVVNDDGTLFGLNAKGRFVKTKFKPEDFKNNPDYIYGRFYKRWGYLNVKDIKYIKYRPVPFLENHVLKDDMLLISYDGPITQTDPMGIDKFKYDLFVDGNFIIEALIALRDSHNWDIADIKEEIWEKCLTLKNVQSFTRDNYFEEAVQSREKFETWWE